MSRFDDMIATMKTVDYREKRQFLEYLVRMAETAKHQFSQEDINSLLSYAFEEVDNMLEAIPAAESYKGKRSNLCVRKLSFGNCNASM